MEERKFTITLSLTDQEFGELRNAVYNQGQRHQEAIGKLREGRGRELCSESLEICKFLYQTLCDVRMKGVLHE